MAQPVGDDAEVIGRLLGRVYESHERIIARGGGGLWDTSGSEYFFGLRPAQAYGYPQLQRDFAC
jgi:hypothetical protein